MPDKDLVEIDLEILGETDKAFKVTDGVTVAWIPKSQIENLSNDWEVGETETMEIPEWLAVDKDLI